MQRTLYVRAQFKFHLSFEYCPLDPMDVIAITDANLGLSAYPVRVVEIEEDDSGVLLVTAEEMTAGLSTAASNPTAAPSGGSINTGIAASAVNAPVIIEPPPALTNNVQQIWLGASASASGVSDAFWGGCLVWASLDNLSYQKIAVINNPVRQGFLTAALPSSAGYDTTTTLAVDLIESGGVLTTASAAAAQAGQTLCLVDGELLSFANATLTAASKYNVTGLQRGMYGSAPASHASGAPFARLDAAIAKYALPPNFVGQTIFLKLQSFNTFGNGVQDLSTCVVYQYAPSGVGQVSLIVQSLQMGTAQDWRFAIEAVTQADDWGTIGGAVYAAVDLGSAAL